MRMGNLLRVSLHVSTMAATNHSVGIAHVTVVPTNAKSGVDENRRFSSANQKSEISDDVDKPDADDEDDE